MRVGRQLARMSSKREAHPARGGISDELSPHAGLTLTTTPLSDTTMAPFTESSTRGRGGGRGGRGGGGGRGRGGGGGGDRGGKNRGFKVGPAHAPKDAYLGKGKPIHRILRGRARSPPGFSL